MLIPLPIFEPAVPMPLLFALQAQHGLQGSQCVNDGGGSLAPDASGEHGKFAISHGDNGETGIVHGVMQVQEPKQTLQGVPHPVNAPAQRQSAQVEETQPPQ